VARAAFIILLVVVRFYIDDGSFFDLEFAILEKEGISFPGGNLDITGDIHVP
jgi:hypothetical protein